MNKLDDDVGPLSYLSLLRSGSPGACYLMRFQVTSV